MIIKQNFKVNVDGTERYGILIVPDDAVKNPELCPLFAFFHGIGEAFPMGSISSVDKIYENGSPLALARDGKLSTVVDPITGKAYRPIVFGLQGLNWAPTADQMAYAIRNSIIPNYPVDLDRIFCTGLSAGGQETHYSLSTPGIMELYAAGMPMSAAGTLRPNYVQMAALGIRVWGYHGDLDRTCDPKYTSVPAAEYNAAKPGFYHLTIFGESDPLAAVSRGHGAWAPIYDRANKRTVKDIAGKAYKVDPYEWLLLNSKGTAFIPEKIQSAETAGAIPPPVSSGTITKAIPVATASGTVVLLDGTSSTGNGGISSSSWLISTQVQPYVKPLSVVSGLMDAGPGVAPKATVTLFPGEYKITLTVQDKYGGKSSQTVPLSVGSPSSPTGPKVVGTVVFNGKTVTLYDDLTYKML